MQVNIHNPKVRDIHTLQNCAHYIDLQESYSNQAIVTIFVDKDWAVWDAIVEAIAIYRETHHDISEV